MGKGRDSKPSRIAKKAAKKALLPPIRVKAKPSVRVEAKPSAPGAHHNRPVIPTPVTVKPPLRDGAVDADIRGIGALSFASHDSTETADAAAQPPEESAPLLTEQSTLTPSS